MSCQMELFWKSKYSAFLQYVSIQVYYPPLLCRVPKFLVAFLSLVAEYLVKNFRQLKVNQYFIGRKNSNIACSELTL